MYQQHTNYLKHQQQQKFIQNKFKQGFLPYPYMYTTQIAMAQRMRMGVQQPKRDAPMTARNPLTNQLPVQEAKPVKMCSSPDTKFRLEVKEGTKSFFPQKFALENKKSTDTLKTGCTSTESLISATSSSSLNRKGSNDCNMSVFSSMDNTSFNDISLERNLSSAKKGSKCYYNKFNSPSENSNNENTTILTLKIKIAPNDYRTFNLKKFDDLFVSLQKFFSLNQIKQDLIKPIVNQIFGALNRIFWLLNNKIGIYDQEYLNSLYKVWIKNKGKIPQTKKQRHNSMDVPPQQKQNISSYNSFTAGLNNKNKTEKKECNKSF